MRIDISEYGTATIEHTEEDLVKFKTRKGDTLTIKVSPYGDTYEIYVDGTYEFSTYRVNFAKATIEEIQ